MPCRWNRRRGPLCDKRGLEAGPPPGFRRPCKKMLHRRARRKARSNKRLAQNARKSVISPPIPSYTSLLRRSGRARHAHASGDLSACAQLVRGQCSWTMVAARICTSCHVMQKIHCAKVMGKSLWRSTLAITRTNAHHAHLAGFHMTAPLRQLPFREKTPFGGGGGGGGLYHQSQRICVNSNRELSPQRCG